jgi:hypothetical protein
MINLKEEIYFTLINLIKKIENYYGHLNFVAFEAFHEVIDKDLLMLKWYLKYYGNGFMMF